MALDGNWNVTAKLPMGKMDGQASFKVDGTKLLGELKLAGAVATINDGVYDGNHYTGWVEVKTPMGKMRFDVDGTYDEAADTAQGTMNTKIGKATFTGVRI
jgi:hypothetical protein